MKEAQIFGFIVFSSFLVGWYGCKKEQQAEETAPVATNNKPRLSIKTEMKLDPVRRKYIDTTGKTYYSGVFSSNESLYHFFKINLEKGKVYRIVGHWVINDIFGYLLLTLLNENLDVIIGQDNGSNGQIFLKSNYTGIAYLDVTPNDYFAEGMNYRLYVEEIYNYKINWLGRQWEANGDWTVNSDGNLQFVADGIGFKRWIRLNEPDLTSYTASMQMRTLSGSGTNCKGFIVNACDTIYPPEYNQRKFDCNVPISGFLCMANNLGDRKIRYPSFGNNWLEYNTTNAEFSKDAWTAFITTPVSATSRTFSVNNKLVLNYSSDTLTAAIKKGYLYFMMESNSLETLELKDFSIN